MRQTPARVDAAFVVVLARLLALVSTCRPLDGGSGSKILPWQGDELGRPCSSSWREAPSFRRRAGRPTPAALVGSLATIEQAAADGMRWPEFRRARGSRSSSCAGRRPMLGPTRGFEGLGGEGGGRRARWGSQGGPARCAGASAVGSRTRASTARRTRAGVGGRSRPGSLSGAPRSVSDEVRAARPPRAWDLESAG